MHKTCIFWIHLLPVPKCFNPKYHRTAFPYLWSNLMVIGANMLLSKLAKATLKCSNLFSPPFIINREKSSVLALT